MKDFVVGILPDDNPISEIMKSGYNYGFDTGYRAGVESAQPKWISVEERLPGHGAGMFFIVCRDDGAVHEARFEISNGRWYELTTEGLWEIDVNHWMPLPEPPKEETCLNLK